MVKQEPKTTFQIKGYNKKQLIEELNLNSYNEFNKIIKDHSERIGEQIGRFYTPKQVRVILDLVLAYKGSKKSR